MLKTALNKSDLIYLLQQQERLDESMRTQLGISDREWKLEMTMEHVIALNDELHEFINATHSPWKYWKRKEMDMYKVLDEAVDVVHFSMLLFNKRGASLEWTAESVAETIADKRSLKNEREVKSVMYHLSNNNYSSTERQLCAVLQILDYYNFNTADIITQYDNKNKKNFERLNSGY